MPLVLGGAAIAVVIVALLLIITLYWVLFYGERTARSLPAIGGILGDVFAALRNRNAELLGQVVDVSVAVISWSVDRVHDGFQILSTIYNAAIVSQLGALNNSLNSLRFWRDTVATAAISTLQGQYRTLATIVNGFVLANIQAFQFWKDATTALLRDTVLPNLASLTLAVDHIAGFALPQLRQQIDALTAQTLGWILTNGRQLEIRLANLQTTTTAVLSDPVKGVVPRVGTLEGDIARVMPWAAAIGLSIPVAINLAKLGRNPCWCSTEGPLQDNGTLELATLMDLL